MQQAEKHKLEELAILLEKEAVSASYHLRNGYSSGGVWSPKTSSAIRSAARTLRKALELPRAGS